MSLNYEKIFLELGLPEVETKIYLTSLKLGAESVQNIAKAAKLSRTAVYDGIEALQGRGLMSTVRQGRKKYFIAEDPERAVSYFKGHIKALDEKVDLLKGSIRDLELLGAEKPNVRLYEGDEAIKVLFDDLAKSRAKEVYELVDLDSLDKSVNKEKLDQAKEVIRGKDLKVTAFYKHAHKDLSDRKAHYTQLPAGIADFDGVVWVYDDRIAFVSLNGKITLIIMENKIFADTIRVLFQVINKSTK